MHGELEKERKKLELEKEHALSEVMKVVEEYKTKVCGGGQE